MLFFDASVIKKFLFSFRHVSFVWNRVQTTPCTVVKNRYTHLVCSNGLSEWIMCRCPHCRHSPPHCRYLFDICRLYFEKYHKHIYCKEATDIYLRPLLNRCGYVLWRSLNDELVKNSDSMFGFDVNMDYRGLVRSLVCWFCKKAIIPEENHDNYHTFLVYNYHYIDIVMIINY